MTVASDLKQAAIDVFDALTGVPIAAAYIQVNAAPYVAGGELVKNETSYPLRIIKEKRSELAMAMADDVSSSDEKYLFVTDELLVPAAKDDRIEIGADAYVVTDFENDAVGAVTTLYLRSA